MHACMHVCMYGCMDGWIDVCKYVCMYIYVCIDVYMNGLIFLMCNTYLEPQKLLISGLQLCPIDHKKLQRDLKPCS